MSEPDGGPSAKGLGATLRGWLRASREAVSPAGGARRGLARALADERADDAALIGALESWRFKADGDPNSELVFAVWGDAREGPGASEARRSLFAGPSASAARSLRAQGLGAWAANVAFAVGLHHEAARWWGELAAGHAQRGSGSAMAWAAYAYGEAAWAHSVAGAAREADGARRDALLCWQRALSEAPTHRVAPLLAWLDEDALLGFETDLLRVLAASATERAAKGDERTAARCWMRAERLARSVTPRLAPSLRARGAELSVRSGAPAEGPPARELAPARALAMREVRDRPELALALACADTSAPPRVRARAALALWSWLEAPAAPLADALGGALPEVPALWFAPLLGRALRARPSRHAALALALMPVAAAQRALLDAARTEGPARPDALHALQHAPAFEGLRAARLDALYAAGDDPALRGALLHALARDPHPEAEGAVRYAAEFGPRDARAAARAALDLRSRGAR